jgi:putative FmdB family regulatory protein
MPIYAYKCASCGHAKDVLQKMSDDPLTECPACGAAAFSKQVTAAGFQLKGSGWYVTDFRSNAGGGAAPVADKAGDKAADTKPAEKSAEKAADTAAKPADSGTKPADSSSTTKSGTPSASAGGSGASAGH